MIPPRIPTCSDPLPTTSAAAHTTSSSSVVSSTRRPQAAPNRDRPHPVRTLAREPFHLFFEIAFREDMAIVGSPEYQPTTMARIQERQANWTRKARETSEASVSASASASSTGGSPSNTDRAAANPPASSASTAPAPTASTAPANTKSSAGPARTQKTKPSRKKVAKACLACQKSHLTCDECE